MMAEKTRRPSHNDASQDWGAVGRRQKENIGPVKMTGEEKPARQEQRPKENKPFSKNDGRKRMAGPVKTATERDWQVYLK